MPLAHLTRLGLLGILVLGGGCEKKNRIDVDDSDGSMASCDGQAPCDGACVEGVCREACDQNYTCPTGKSCELIEDQAVCLDVPMRQVADYEPLDLLSDCALRDGCQIGIDPLELEGVFANCGTFAEQQLQDPDFDYAAACDRDFQHASRTIVRGLSSASGDANCGLVGRAGERLIRTCYGSWMPASFQYEELREADGEIYSWAPLGSPTVLDAAGRPAYASNGARLAKFLPGLSEEEHAELDGCDNRQDACDVATFPRIAGPASDLAGLWVECDQRTDIFATNLRDGCDGSWSESVQRARLVYYIREDGFGQQLHTQAPIGVPQPTACDTAFRRGPEDGLVVLQSALGSVSAQLTPATVFGDGEGEYLVFAPAGLAEDSLQRTLKRVEPDDGFVDPCEDGLPEFRF